MSRRCSEAIYSQLESEKERSALQLVIIKTKVIWWNAMYWWETWDPGSTGPTLNPALACTSV